MKVKTFTLKEANRFLPTVKGTFDDIFVMKKKIAIMKSEVDWIRSFWGKELRDSDNPDGEKHDKMIKEVENLVAEIHKKVSGLEKKGCIVKDADAGLVDFYSTINNELIFLCWRYGEKKIEFWHPVDGGSGVRRPFGRIDRIE